MFVVAFTRRAAFFAAILALLWLPVYAQTDPWIHAEPTRVVPRELAVFSCIGGTTVHARWVFFDGGYRVIQTPVVSRTGQTISLDARIEETTGARTLALVPFEKSFTLGVLEPGSYTLDFKSWDTSLKKIEFTVSPIAPAPNPSDNLCSFVGQHYRDFLSREGDGSGLAFWIDELVKCGNDPQCLETKRVNVSAAFFLSNEFRETGYYAYRMYKAALGRPPTFAEFVADAAELGRNVVVGSDDPWVIRLSSNKDIYTMRFFNRADFQSRYTGLTTAQYIDKLFETEGITPTSTERNGLIDSLDRCSFTIGCPTRITVLRQIVEHPVFDRKVFNESFVTMEYFGYLRRDPDPAGLQFWLNKLNQFNGNFIEAEMVKAFLKSDEYRKRF